MSSLIKEIPINQLIPPWTMLRPVRESSVEYLEMVDSIRQEGLLKSLLVRAHPTREGMYEIIDGMWRFICCKELDFSDLPCILKVNVTDDEHFMSLQIQANAVSYQTRPIEFAEQMQKILQTRASFGIPMTLLELASTVNKSSVWVSTRLKLLDLCDEAQDAVREGKLTLGKAVALSRIWLHRYQLQFLKIANDMKVRDFELEIGKFIAKKREEKISKRREARDEISLKPRLQTMDSLLIELDRLENISEIIISKGLTTALEGAKITLEWVLNLHERGRDKQIREIRHKLSDKDRFDIIGRQRYEELKKLRDLKNG